MIRRDQFLEKLIDIYGNLKTIFAPLVCAPDGSTSSDDTSPFNTYMNETIEIKSRSPRLYLVICNIQSLANVKALMNTAFAFGCFQVWIVGQSKNLQKSTWIPKQFQDALDQSQITLLMFPKWNDCLEHLHNSSPKISLVGVEIDANSQLLDDIDATPPFVADHNDIAILMGNEGQGIHPRHLEACQGRLIRIPQYGVGTASFNVNVACSIVLYHFHQWKYRQLLADNGAT